jgi:hypothetical protein
MIVNLAQTEAEDGAPDTDEAYRLFDTTLNMAIILDPVDASCATIGADHHAQEALV